MAVPYAFVTLLTSDAYLPGALALAGALKDVHSVPPVSPEVEYQTVCLVTPETVDVSTIKLLCRTFDVVVGVEIIEQEDDKGLKLLGEYFAARICFVVDCRRVRASSDGCDVVCPPESTSSLQTATRSKSASGPRQAPKTMREQP